MSPEHLAAHLRIAWYGDFWLTEAIRPALDRHVVPRQGYRVATYRDAAAPLEVPKLAAAVSREWLFEVFLALLDPLGAVVHVVLETRPARAGAARRAFYRKHIELPLLQRHFCAFDELLLHDGCTGVAVISANKPMEVQFDEHKLLVVYACKLKPFETILRHWGVRRDDRLKLITEGAHLHGTDPRYTTAFEQLCSRLGVAEAPDRGF